MNVRTFLSLRRLHRLARSRVDGKGALRQWLEMIALFALRGNGPNFYQMAGFWRRGQTWRVMLGHLSYRRVKAHVDALNPPAYQKLSQNKLAEKAILTLMGIPTPRFVGLLDPAWGRDSSGAPLRGPDDLVRLVRGICLDRLCLKPLEGHGGHGFVAVDVLRGEPEPRFGLLGPSESIRAGVANAAEPDTCSASELIARLGEGPRLIEAYLEQHPVFAAFNPSSVNTLRIWVLHSAGRTSTKMVYLKIGRRGAVVDNRGSGGIVAPIDVRTGRVSTAVDCTPERNLCATHPDHGAQIEGVVLPMLEEAMALAERCLKVFPRLNLAGIDVAMTPSGPSIIELNSQPGRNGAAYVEVPTRDVFANLHR